MSGLGIVLDMKLGEEGLGIIVSFGTSKYIY